MFHVQGEQGALKKWKGKISNEIDENRTTLLSVLSIKGIFGARLGAKRRDKQNGIRGELFGAELSLLVVQRKKERKEGNHQMMMI